ncbi:uncharacterized protein LOC122860151 [Aphidius gifuensis]|uniref:uncharacterized protein LOC122860151 n=1 Tax=Aphidius gifuensis TaxID=684658 RepID=UPI001CDB510E|nr:uncharacterized protein LOC122860151 [Aphidius gifuensis]
MNVKRTFQMFGRRYAAAMKTAGHANLLISSKTWMETAGFIERCNDAIDALNTLTNKDEKRLNMKRVISDRNPQVENCLIDFLKWTLKWKVPFGSHPGFLDGLPMTISSILNLYHDLKLQFVDFELATGLLNQDNVEHLFSKFRQRGGNNANPTARGIRISTGHILSNGFTYKSAGCNTRKTEKECKSLLDTDNNEISLNIITSSSYNEAHKINNKNDSMSEEWNEEESDSEEDDDVGVLEDVDTLYGETKKSKESVENVEESQENIYEELDEYAQQAITYFCGFIVRRGLQKYNCGKCRNDWLKTPLDQSTNSEGYLRYREYTADHDLEDPDVLHLFRPQDNLVKIFSLFLKIFDEIWNKFWHYCPLLKTIIIESIKSIKNIKKTSEEFYLVKEWFDKSKPCYQHRIYFMQYVLKIKIIARTRLHNQESKLSNKIQVYKKNNQKLKNLYNM